MTDGRFIRVDDFDMWVETLGDGPPLLLLSSSFATTEMLSEQAAILGRYFTVHVFDARGGGRSGFGSGPITYARQAADAAALMDALGLADAHLHGHSDGGCIALHLLFDYPHRVRTATLSGTPYSRDCYTPEVAQLCCDLPLALSRGEADPLGVQARLLEAGLSPEKIRALGAGLRRAWSTTPNFTLEMLGDLDRPVLVVEAGSDPLIHKDHFEALTRAIPGARAVVLADMTHDPRPHAEAVAQAMAAFVAETADA
jgi:pimeloyl-ACP methyl ester carboxylesterase